MSSEDFAFFSEAIPAVHRLIGSKIEDQDTAIHRSNYECNPLAIPTGVRGRHGEGLAPDDDNDK